MPDVKRFEGSDHYVATDDLRVAVNAAVALDGALRVEAGGDTWRP